MFQILSKHLKSQKQILFIFKNAKISTSLAQKINALATPIKPKIQQRQAPKKPQSSSVPKILTNYLEERGNIAPYNPQGKSIRERRPKLFEFLTNPKMTYSQKDYDFGFEDEFSVVWIDPTNPQDAELIRRFREKYKNSLSLLSEFTHDARPSPPLSTNETTRFANNDTFAFLNLGHTRTIARDMIRDVLIWAATREICRIKNIPFPNQQVIREIFG